MYMLTILLQYIMMCNIRVMEVVYNTGLIAIDIADILNSNLVESYRCML